MTTRHSYARSAAKLLVAGTLVLLPLLVAAQTGQTGGGGPTGQTGCPNGTCTVVNPLNVDNFPDLINKVLQGALVIAVPIIILFIVYSGFLFVTARGDTTKLATARLNFFYVVIGSIVLLGAMAIASVIANTIRSFGVPV